MRVSVVIPTYNSGSVVVVAVQSVLAQTRGADEIIVVDDGSTDDTQTRLAAFGDRINYIRKPNGGVALARNRGIQEATGEFIAFLDADDFWHPKKLEMQVGVLEANPQLAMLGTESFSWPTDIIPKLDNDSPRLSFISFEGLVVRNKFDTSSIIVRADCLREVGGFDLSFQGPEDFDLWLRISLKAKAGVMSTLLTGYNHGNLNSLSKQAVRMEKDTLRILAKHAAEGAFRGRPFLYQRAIANHALIAAYRYSQAGMLSEAFSRLIQSFVRWPLPFSREDVRAFCARPRLAVALMRRIIAEKLSNRPDSDSANEHAVLA